MLSFVLNAGAKALNRRSRFCSSYEVIIRILFSYEYGIYNIIKSIKEKKVRGET